jgi:hypothetical protein
MEPKVILAIFFESIVAIIFVWGMVNAVSAYYSSDDSIDKDINANRGNIYNDSKPAAISAEERLAHREAMKKNAFVSIAIVAFPLSFLGWLALLLLSIK